MVSVYLVKKLHKNPQLKKTVVFYEEAEVFFNEEADVKNKNAKRENFVRYAQTSRMISVNLSDCFLPVLHVRLEWNHHGVNHRTETNQSINQ